MEYSKDSNKIIDDIIKELEILKNKNLDSSVELYKQTEAIDNISSNLEDVRYQSEISKWQLNYIDSTFARLYKKINSYPIRESTSNFFRLFSLKSKILSLGFYKTEAGSSETNQNIVNRNDKLEKIENLILEAKNIALLNRDELDKQQLMLDYGNELACQSQCKISKNTRKIKKLLN